MHKFLIVIILFFLQSLFAQEEVAWVDSASAQMLISDSTNLALKDSSTFTDTVNVKPVTTRKRSAEAQVEEKEKARRGTVKREFNYRHQMATAFGMMLFLTIIMTVGQNWNPE